MYIDSRKQSTETRTLVVFKVNVLCVCVELASECEPERATFFNTIPLESTDTMHLDFNKKKENTKKKPIDVWTAHYRHRNGTKKNKKKNCEPVGPQIYIKNYLK